MASAAGRMRFAFLACLAIALSTSGCIEELIFCGGAETYHEAIFRSPTIFDTMPTEGHVEGFWLSEAGLRGRAGFPAVANALDSLLGPGNYKAVQVTQETSAGRFVLHRDGEIYLSHPEGVSKEAVRQGFFTFVRELTSESDAEMDAWADQFASQHAATGHVRHAMTPPTIFLLDDLYARLDDRPGDLPTSDLQYAAEDWTLQVAIKTKRAFENDNGPRSGLHVDALGRAMYVVVAESERRPDFEERLDDVFEALDLGDPPTEWEYRHWQDC